MQVEFRIVGQTPLPKQSFRYSSKGHFIKASMKAWQDEISWASKQAMLGKDMLRGDLGVVFYFVRDNRRTVDFDNLSKAACDAMNKIVYKDDNAIVDAKIHKRYGHPPGVYILVYEIDDLWTIDIETYTTKEINREHL